MAESILDQETRLTRSDARLFQQLAKDKAWLRGVTPEKRKQIVDKIIAAFDNANPKIISGMRTITSLAATLIALDKTDLDREKMGIAMELELEKHGIVSAATMPAVVYVTARPKSEEVVIDAQDVVTE